MPLPPIDVVETFDGGGIMFLYCSSMSASICPCIRACILLAQHLTKQWMKFHQTLAICVVEATDELFRF